jgi:hypothetical protein
MRRLKDRKIFLVSPDTPADRRKFYINNAKRAMITELLDMCPADQYKTITFKVGTLSEHELETELRNIYRHGLNSYIYDGCCLSRECAEALIKQSYITVEMTVEVDDV